LTFPTLECRSRAIRKIVAWLTERLEIAGSWRYDLAATMCLVGCVALPEDVFERAYAGEPLSRDEEEMFRAHPQRAAQLLSKIPRLESVAEIIRRQQRTHAEQVPISPPEAEVKKLGADLLHLAIELDRRIFRGVPVTAAIAEFRHSRRFEPRLLNA